MPGPSTKLEEYADLRIFSEWFCEPLKANNCPPLPYRILNLPLLVGFAESDMIEKNVHSSTLVKHSRSFLSDLSDSQSNANLITVQCIVCNCLYGAWKSTPLSAHLSTRWERTTSQLETSICTHHTATHQFIWWQQKCGALGWSLMEYRVAGKHYRHHHPSL